MIVSLIRLCNLFMIILDIRITNASFYICIDHCRERENNAVKAAEVNNVEQKAMGYHETMEAHEIFNMKTTCLLKSKMMQGICFDNDLKTLMEKDVQQSMQAIRELQALYKKARTNYTQ